MYILITGNSYDGLFGDIWSLKYLQKICIIAKVMSVNVTCVLIKSPIYPNTHAKIPAHGIRPSSK